MYVCIYIVYMYRRAYVSTVIAPVIQSCHVVSIVSQLPDICFARSMKLRVYQLVYIHIYIYL